MDKNKLKGSILLILISLSWAGSFVIVRLTYQEISPINLGFLRFFIATPIMIMIFLFRKKKVYLPAKELISLSILGLTGVTLLYIFQFIGISLTTASTSAVLINTNVIFIVILSTILLKEKFSFKKISGVSLSFIGVFIVIFSQMSNEQINISNAFLIGCIFVVLSAICWSVYSIVGKKLLIKYDPFTITTYSFTFGTIFFLPIVFPGVIEDIQSISLNGWLAILYLGLICSVFAYFAWYYVLSKNQVSTSAVFLNLIPLFTIIISFFIGEMPTILFLIGAILIIYGVYQAQK